MSRAAGSSKGRTRPFGGWYLGSSPSPAARLMSSRLIFYLKCFNDKVAPMRKLILPIFLTVFLPSFVFAADVTISGAITSDTTWSPLVDGVYIIDSSFSVSPGVTLTIEPGTIIKARTTAMGGPSIYGTLLAQGTSELPIYFTSIWDDSIGGDTDGGGPSVSTPGEWQGLYFKEGSLGELDHVVVRYSGYGGYGYGDFVGIENDGGTLDIKNSNIHDNYRIISDGAGGVAPAGTGIYNKRGTFSISDSIIDHQATGIYIISGTSTIARNIIRNHFGTGFGANGEGPLTLVDNIFSGNRGAGSLDIAKPFVHSGNTSSDLTNRGFVMTGIARDGMVLESMDLPILVLGSITVEAGKTMTIAPGTILKFGGWPWFGSMDIRGTLIAHGTTKDKIYLTSIYDDSVGGDTNGDGDATTPAPRNWNAVYLENGSVTDFDNVVLRYSGYNFNGEYLPGVAAAIYHRGAEFSVSNSIFEHNWVTAIYQDAGTTVIDHSEFMDQPYGVWSRGGNITISQSSIHDNAAVAIYNESGQTIDARNNWWGSADGPQDTSTSTPTGTGDRVSWNVLYDPWLTSDPLLIPTRNPVIIVPGIMGSAYKNGVLVIDPILHTYDDLIATLIANGYENDFDLFTFPYEWRDSNVFSANLLDDKIEEVKAICDCGKVDIVAHSMGGLVARSYIQSGDYDGDVDQLVFLGTPHKGAPTDYLQWEAGKFPNTFFDILIELFFEVESLRNGYLTIFNYIHNRPILSVQELLPTFDYLKDDDTGAIRTYPNNYPQNYFLESLNNNISNLLNSGVEITNIVGNSGSNTIEKIRVVPSTHSGLWEHGEPDGFYTVFGDKGLERGIGDNTVTIFGATLNSSIINQEISDNHQRIPTVAEAKIFNILTGKTASTTFDNDYGVDKKILLIQLLSPVDFMITAPNEKKIGKNFQTGEEYNQIQDAFYSGYQTDNEYITILNPLDGKYKIEVQGTDNGGQYGILTSYVSDGFATTTETVGITEPDQITNLEVQIDNINPQNITTQKEITLEVLTNDINGAYNLGWIKDRTTRDYLLKKVHDIIKYDSRGGITKVDRKLAKLVLVDLSNFLKKKNITIEAYNLLKTDLEWLINH